MTPGSPFSRIRTLCPLSIPAGIVTWIFLFLAIYPVPRQSGHLSLTTLPVPLQSGQVWTFCTVPKKDCCVNTTFPLPPHLVHVSGFVPGLAPVPWQTAHSSFRTISISFSHPKTASSNVILTLVRRFAPFIGPSLPLLLAPPPPKKSPKISPKISPISMPEKSNPPAPPPVPSNAA